MLNLLKNIFSQAEVGTKLPSSLVNMAIERAVDGTDPRVRIVSGYAKALREPVTHAIEYVVDLVESFPAPVVVDRAALTVDPAFGALFYSQERMEQILAHDAALRDFRAAAPAAITPVTALLAAQRTQKRGFGTALVGDRVMSDVPRTTVSFEEHRLLEPASDEQETRRLLKRRAFDHILSIALAQITAHKEGREGLANRRALLRARLDVLRRSGGFSSQASTTELGQLQARLGEIDGQLSALGSREDALSDNMDIAAGVLAAAEQHLWQQDNILCLDKLYVLHDKPAPAAPPIAFRELHNSEGLQATVMLISIGS